MTKFINDDKVKGKDLWFYMGVFTKRKKNKERNDNIQKIIRKKVVFFYKNGLIVNLLIRGEKEIVGLLTYLVSISQPALP